MEKYNIYRHIRLDNNKVFYIGIGNNKRPYSKKGRNNYWKRITIKTEYEIDILKSDLSWKDAKELEIILISYYGRDNLCNMTDGGEGSLNCIPGEETRKKISEFHKGKPKSKEAKEKMSKAKEGMYLLGSNPNSKKVMNINTNEIFNTLKEAANKEGIKYSTFKWAIKHKTNFNYKYL